ncbi:MAG: NUDIX domain-containing protein [Clostridia bacterium]|nr:NUDIX domain-containing protein [Clostridia bacterium]
MKDYVDVAAALIWRDGKFLICQRPAHKSNALLWEFVGGKAEPGETPEEALVRECREELDVTVVPTKVFMRVMHTYPDIKVLLTLFDADLVEGTPKMLEHNDLRWITPEEIEEYRFCPADKDILREIRARAGCLAKEEGEKTMYKFGMSIVPRVFDCDAAKEFEKKMLEEFGGMDAMLAEVKSLGLTHIELRGVDPDDDATEILAMAERIWAAGLTVTVHGSLTETIGRFAEVYPSLLLLLQAAKSHQEFVNITVHAYSSDEDTDVAKFSADTAQILALWAEDAAELGYRLTLENNRDKEAHDPGNSCEGVLAMLSPHDAIGTCFDFGHYYYNMCFKKGTPDLLPPQEFLQRARHTHIHALYEKKTHFPFVAETVMPLERYISTLKAVGYDGVYNLEINAERFKNVSYRDSVVASIKAIREAVLNG